VRVFRDSCRWPCGCVRSPSTATVTATTTTRAHENSHRHSHESPKTSTRTRTSPGNPHPHLHPHEPFRAVRYSLWICIIDAPNVGRFGGTALAITTASPRIASPAPTSVCATLAIISSVDSKGFATRREVTPQ